MLRSLVTFCNNPLSRLIVYFDIVDTLFLGYDGKSLINNFLGETYFVTQMFMFLLLAA